MIALYLSPIYILLHIYLTRWLLKWLRACHPIFQKRYSTYIIISIIAFLASPLAIGILIPHGYIKGLVYQIGFFWLGMLIFMTLLVVFCDMIRVILKYLFCRQLSKKAFIIIGMSCIILTSSISIYGYVNAHHLQTQQYHITINKNTPLDHLRVTLVSDLHLGYNIKTQEVKNMVQAINIQNPDLVVISGDIFDNDYDAILNPEQIIDLLQNIHSQYGVYACYGNHDIQETILAGFTFDNPQDKDKSDPRMDEFLHKAHIRLLHDEGICIDSYFYLYGRADLQKPGRNIDSRQTPSQITQNMDKQLPIIVIDHQPAQLHELANAGVDLDLSGHTHAGQIFPGNIITSKVWENSYGCKKINQMYSVVTSGVGLFGPYMRIGSHPEICNINITFQA